MELTSAINNVSWQLIVNYFDFSKTGLIKLETKPTTFLLIYRINYYLLFLLIEESVYDAEENTYLLADQSYLNLALSE